MTPDFLDSISRSILYEGYVLYPYRPAVKNRHRFTFGSLYPETYCRAQQGAEAATMQAELLVEGDRQTRLEARVRFLHVTQRVVHRIDPRREHWADEADACAHP